MKYLRHINESDLSELTTTFKNLIKWNIVDDAKDMALEYLDENANNVLFIEIKYETFNRYMRNNLETLDIYACNYRYKNLKEDWNNIEDDGHSLYKEKIDVNKIKYYFYIYEVIEGEYQDVETIKMKETYEIQERLKSLYHNNIGDVIEETAISYRFARTTPLKNPYTGDKLHEDYTFNEEEDVISCFYDLSDFGFEVKCDLDGNVFYVSINKSAITNQHYLNNFNVGDVKESLLFAIPYICEIYNASICYMSAYAYVRFVNKTEMPYWEWVTFTDLQDFFTKLDNTINIRRINIQLKINI